MKAAVVGLGSMGRRYADILLEHPDEPDIALCDTFVEPDIKQLKNFPHREVSFFQEYDRLLKNFMPDVIFIATPARFHFKMAMQARASDKRCAILIQKPLSNTDLTDEQVRWCVEESGLISVGYNWRFHTLVQHLHGVKNNIEDITFFVASDMRNWPGKDYADPLREFSHDIDLVSYLTTNAHVTQVTERKAWNGNERIHIRGEHDHGIWRVIVSPFEEPTRWCRVKLTDGLRLNKRMALTNDDLMSLYSQEAHELIVAWADGRGPEDLTCPLTDALRTTLLVDRIGTMVVKNTSFDGFVM
jgi:predicted dehydrogenase